MSRPSRRPQSAPTFDELASEHVRPGEAELAYLESLALHGVPGGVIDYHAGNLPLPSAKRLKASAKGKGPAKKT